MPGGPPQTLSAGPLARGSGAGTEFIRWVQHSLNLILGLQLPVDGLMTPETRQAVRGFQTRMGLPADGIVGPETERALAAERRKFTSGGAPGEPATDSPDEASSASLGEFDTESAFEEWEGEVSRSSPEYIRWVQRSLNQILGLRLAVDGINGPQTRSAVRGFQQRQGLTVDGIVGPQTEQALVAAGASPPPQIGTRPTRPLGGVNTPLPSPGPGYYSYKSQGRRYGLPETIRALEAIGAAWQRAHPSEPRIGIGDISLQGGGPMSGHKSHQKGVDVDLRLVRNDGVEGPVRYQFPTYSRSLTQELADLIRNNGVLRVQYIFFNDPRVTGVRKWPGHDDHLHVRFYPPGAAASETDLAEEWATALTDEAETEVSRSSREYVRWVQRSLNQVLGLRLLEDGIVGRQTRSAIRRFQQRQGLDIDGIVGTETERSLISAGASRPPQTRVRTAGVGQPSLADLHAFSRGYTDQIIQQGKKLDCADLAIELWIMFAEQFNLPITFKIWDSARRRYVYPKRQNFSSAARFVRYVQINLGALGLINNTNPVPGGHRHSVAGDVFLWEYRHQTTGARHRIGHTQILYEINRGAAGPNTDRIVVAQGSLPPIVPQLIPKPATYFGQARAAIIGGEPHWGQLIGTGPRRFAGFRGLR